MIFDPVYMVLMIFGLLISLGAAGIVKMSFAKYSKVGTQSGLTGAQVARRMLDNADLHDVKIEQVQGHLSDHYDPRSHILRLSPRVYQSNSIAALGVAAHEAGHALQQATSYAPLFLRNAVVPVAGIGTNLGFWLVILGAMFGGRISSGGFGGLMVTAGLFLFGAFVFFTLITLPVEFNASRRAMAALRNDGYLTKVEADGARKVLTAAAMTYVAAAVVAIMQFLYLFLRARD
jgi:uncharacterized protein